MRATATCRSSTGTRSWALFLASISAASNWIAWTKRPVCGRGSDGRNQRTTTAELEARPVRTPCYEDAPRAVPGRYRIDHIAAMATAMPASRIIQKETGSGGELARAEGQL